VRLLDLRAEGFSPSGSRIGGWLDRVGNDRDLGRERLTVAADARLVEESERAPDGWEVTSRRVVSASGLPETVGIDPITSALMAGCDGRLPLETVAELLSVASGIDLAQVHRVAAHLVETGHLVIAG
jgi:hypothetical protein